MPRGERIANRLRGKPARPVVLCGSSTLSGGERGTPTSKRGRGVRLTSPSRREASVRPDPVLPRARLTFGIAMLLAGCRGAEFCGPLDSGALGNRTSGEHPVTARVKIAGQP